MIEIITNSTLEPVQADYAKNYLHWGDFTPEMDTIVNDYITAARELIEKTLNLSLTEKTYKQWFTSDDIIQDRISLFYPPHSKINKVVKVDKNGDETELILNSNYYAFKGFSWQIEIHSSGYWFYVEFDSGYTTCPAAIKMAIVEQVGNWYEGNNDMGELSQAVRQKVNVFSMNSIV